MARTAAGPVGTVGAHLRDDDGDPSVAVIFGMHVAAARRRQGIGAALLRSLVDRVSAQPGITTIRLWVTESQPASHRLYERCGFREVGVEEDARGRELIMERRIR